MIGAPILAYELEKFLLRLNAGDLHTQGIGDEGQIMPARDRIGLMYRIMYIQQTAIWQGESGWTRYISGVWATNGNWSCQSHETS